ncbi:hypothetical protein [Pontibacter chitinilyticus]|uniref:hypothetical protein n=1 Tax=Pontibacter chitinilyticus TaxID=2674989 RepID=UPI00321A1001
MADSNTPSFKKLLQNPSQVTDILQNPGKKGLEFFQNLTPKEQQYILFAGAAGLLAYGIYVGRKGA